MLIDEHTNRNPGYIKPIQKYWIEFSVKASTLRLSLSSMTPWAIVSTVVECLFPYLDQCIQKSNGRKKKGRKKKKDKGKVFILKFLSQVGFFLHCRFTMLYYKLRFLDFFFFWIFFFFIFFRWFIICLQFLKFLLVQLFFKHLISFFFTTFSISFQWNSSV